MKYELCLFLRIIHQNNLFCSEKWGFSKLRLTVSDWTETKDIDDVDNSVEEDDANDTPADSGEAGAPAAPDESDEEGDSQETAGREGQAQDAVVVTHNSCTTHTRRKSN